VPFIARYRKGSDRRGSTTPNWHLDERVRYLRELEERRAVIPQFGSAEQGKLDDALEAAIRAADSKGRLEDIYLRSSRSAAPSRDRQGGGPGAARRSAAGAPGERSRGRGGELRRRREAGGRCRRRARRARAILVERFAEDADLIGSLREEMWSVGRLASKVRDGKQEAGAKFSDYFDFAENLTKVPSHRILALFRAEKEEILDVAIEPENPATANRRCQPLRAAHHAPLRYRRSWACGRPNG